MTNETKPGATPREAGAVEPVACVSRGALANVGSGQKVYLYTPEDFHQEADDLIYDQSAIDTLRAQLEAAEAEVARLNRINSDLCRVHNQRINDTAKLEARAEAAEAEMASLRVDAERWRHARKLLTIDDIEGAQGAYTSFGRLTSDEECDRADAAIDSARADVPIDARTKEAAP